jgi:hypothetical protein
MNKEIVDKVMAMTESDLEKAVASFVIDDMLHVYGRALDMCYSGDTCSQLGISYGNIRSIDFRRACVAAYYEGKDNDGRRRS